MDALSHAKNIGPNCLLAINYPLVGLSNSSAAKEISCAAEISNAVTNASNSIVLAKQTKTRILKLEEKIERIKVNKIHSIINTPHSDGSITNEERVEEKIDIERRVKEILVALVDEKAMIKFPRGFVAADNTYLIESGNPRKINSNPNNNEATNIYSPVIDAEFSEASDNYSGKNNLASTNNIKNYVPLLSYILSTPAGQKVTYELLEHKSARDASDSSDSSSNYIERRDQALQDFTNLVPDKIADIQPLPIGLYGFTYLNTNYMAITDRVSFHKQRETMVHEAIHTQDEYETRQITAWMLSKDSKYAVRISVADNCENKKSV
ncbi:hypothetical protein J4206_02325 [Candidatus Woesearchaeota archaeon]|nr:hypothetical protein [Candidatus Woesearchaeota archaeon]